MTIAALKKILCLVLIVCHTLCAAQPTNFNNRTVNVSAQVSLGNQTNASRPIIYSPDMTSRATILSTFALSALLGVCIYAYCRYLRNQRRVHPADGGEDGGGGDRGDDDSDDDSGGDGGGSRGILPIFLLSINSRSLIPDIRSDRFPYRAISTAYNFDELPRPFQNGLRTLRRRPINLAGDVMPLEGADERDHQIFMRAFREVQNNEEIVMFPAEGRNFLGHRTDRFQILTRSTTGRIRLFDHVDLHERRAQLVSWRYMLRAFHFFENERDIGNPGIDRRVLESYIMTQRGLVGRLPRVFGRIIHGYAFADRGMVEGNLDIAIHNFHQQFERNNLRLDYSQFEFYR